MVEADAVLEVVGRRAVGARLGRRGIVLEPDEPSRDVEPDAAQEAQLADRRRDVLRELAAGHQHEHDLSRRAVEARRRVDDRDDVGAGEHRPGEGVPEGGDPSGPGQRGVAALPRGAPRAYQVIAVAGDAHLLARRGRRAQHEQVAGQARVRRRAFLDRPLDARSPRRGDDRRQREDEQQDQCRMYARGQQPDDDAETQDPAERREQRHEQVVEAERGPAQHLEPVEVLAAFLVGDGRHGRVQPGDVLLHRDAHPVAEPPLHAVEDDLEIPEQRGRRGETERRDEHLPAVVVLDTVDKDRQPQPDQCLRQRGEQGHGQRQGQQSRLHAVGQLHHPPQRLERRWQVVSRACHGRPPRRARRPR